MIAVPCLLGVVTEVYERCRQHTHQHHDGADARGDGRRTHGTQAGGGNAARRTYQADGRGERTRCLATLDDARHALLDGERRLHLEQRLLHRLALIAEQGGSTLCHTERTGDPLQGLAEGLDLALGVDGADACVNRLHLVVEVVGTLGSLPELIGHEAELLGSLLRLFPCLPELPVQRDELRLQLLGHLIAQALGRHLQRLEPLVGLGELLAVLAELLDRIGRLSLRLLDIVDGLLKDLGLGGGGLELLALCAELLEGLGHLALRDGQVARDLLRQGRERLGEGVGHLVPEAQALLGQPADVVRQLTHPPAVAAQRGVEQGYLLPVLLAHTGQRSLGSGHLVDARLPLGIGFLDGLEVLLLGLDLVVQLLLAVLEVAGVDGQRLELRDGLGGLQLDVQYYLLLGHVTQVSVHTQQDYHRRTSCP